MKTFGLQGTTETQPTQTMSARNNATQGDGLIKSLAHLNAWQFMDICAEDFVHVLNNISNLYLVYQAS